MIKLNIITRCTRPQYLNQVKSSIFNPNLFEYIFSIKWWVVFDTRVIKDIDAEFLSELTSSGNEAVFLKGD